MHMHAHVQDALARAHAHTQHEHKFSPKMCQAIVDCKQTMWCNTVSDEGLLGRRDVPLRSAIGVPIFSLEGQARASLHAGARHACALIYARPPVRTHAYMHARTHARTHARMQLISVLIFFAGDGMQETAQVGACTHVARTAWADVAGSGYFARDTRGSDANVEHAGC